MSFEPVTSECPRTDIAAYIDGELAGHEELALEMHLAGCPLCAGEMNLQKQFLSALNSTLENEKELELPKNFTKVIITSAESRVSGLRGSGERFNAVFICAALFLFVLFALGSDAGNVFERLARILDQSLAVVGLIGHLLFNITMGTAVILKFLTSQFVSGSSVAFVLLACVLTLGLFAFSRLRFRYNRT
jgi:anti-sigma factor RsiW